LAEHAVFDLFYNRPLTLRRRMDARAKRRASIRPRRWHAPLVAAGAWTLIAQLPLWILIGREGGFSQNTIWWLMAAAAIIGGLATCRLAGGASTGSRIASGAICGLLISVFTGVLIHTSGAADVWETVKILLLPAFGCTLAALAATLILELNPPRVD
jgi:hypothetical protein